MSVIGRTSTMPIQGLSTSCDTNYLISTSTSPETLQLIDSQQLKINLNQKKIKGGKKQTNSFFADLEGEDEQEQNQSDEDDDDDDDDSSDEGDSSDEELRKPPKKKKKKRHF